MNYDKLQAATAIRRTTTTAEGLHSGVTWLVCLDGGKGLGRKPVKGAKNCTKINKEKNARGVSNKILDKYTEKNGSQNRRTTSELQGTIREEVY